MAVENGEVQGEAGKDWTTLTATKPQWIRDKQINIIVHNTLRVPGHFHSTVVGGTALAFMAVTYYVLPLVFRRRVAFWGMARIQPYVFGLGIVILSMSMIFQGIFGVPRRHWDVTFSNAPFQVEYHPAVQMFQATMGLGGLLAIVGGLMYIVIAVVTVFFGRPFRPEDRDPSGVPPGVWRLPQQVHEGPAAAAIHRTGAPGTIVLVFIFFGCFVLYYFANWKILSFLWKVG